jgi:hypothetical protein
MSAAEDLTIGWLYFPTPQHWPGGAKALEILAYTALLSAAALILVLIATARDPLRYHGHPLVYWLKKHRKASANFRDSEAQAAIETRALACFVLGSIKSDPDQVVPALRRLIAETNTYIRLNAASALLSCEQDPGELLPLVLSAVASPEPRHPYVRVRHPHLPYERR